VETQKSVQILMTTSAPESCGPQLSNAPIFTKFDKNIQFLKSLLIPFLNFTLNVLWWYLVANKTTDWSQSVVSLLTLKKTQLHSAMKTHPVIVLQNEPT